ERIAAAAGPAGLISEVGAPVDLAIGAATRPVANRIVAEHQFQVAGVRRAWRIEGPHAIRAAPTRAGRPRKRVRGCRATDLVVAAQVIDFEVVTPNGARGRESAL